MARKKRKLTFDERAQIVQVKADKLGLLLTHGERGDTHVYYVGRKGDYNPIRCYGLWSVEVWVKGFAYALGIKFRGDDMLEVDAKNIWIQQ